MQACCKAWGADGLPTQPPVLLHRRDCRGRWHSTPSKHADKKRRPCHARGAGAAPPAIFYDVAAVKVPAAHLRSHTPAPTFPFRRWQEDNAVPSRPDLLGVHFRPRKYLRAQVAATMQMQMKTKCVALLKAVRVPALARCGSGGGIDTGGVSG
eukprot:356160-Chlamydomonas_euryale.AAC.5